MPPSRSDRFRSVLCPDDDPGRAAATDATALRDLSWGGIPDVHRPEAWRVLCGVAPTGVRARDEAVKRRRDEYRKMAEEVYDEVDGGGAAGKAAEGDGCAATDSADEAAGSGSVGSGGGGGTTACRCPVLKQIRRDVPRTQPDLALFRRPSIRQRLERVLYVRAKNRPDCSYAQGMNDLAVPFFVAFLKGHGGLSLSGRPNVPMEDDSGGEESDDVLTTLDEVEADSYLCLDALLSSLPDHFLPDQSGALRSAAFLDDVLSVVDPELRSHLRERDVRTVHFSFRWMSCLLVRDLPLHGAIRLFDAYLSEDPDGLESFHVYCCVALLHMFRKELLHMDNEGIMVFLTHLPREELGRDSVDVILGQAHVWRETYGSEGPKLLLCHKEIEEKGGGNCQEPAREDRTSPEVLAVSMGNADFLFY